MFVADVQSPAPNFKGTAVINNEFKSIQLSDYRGKYLVLFFYPLDLYVFASIFCCNWYTFTRIHFSHFFSTFVCPTEIIAFSDRIAEFKAINTEVVGVSVDSEFSHLAWCNQDRKHGGLGQLNYPLLSDLNKQISIDYDVLLKDAGVALRGLFIIDPKVLFDFHFSVHFIIRFIQC